MLSTRLNNQTTQQLIPYKLADQATKSKKQKTSALTEDKLQLLARSTKKSCSQSPFASRNDRLSKRSTSSYTPSIADSGISDMSYACSEVDPRDRCSTFSDSECGSIKPRTPFTNNTTITNSKPSETQVQPELVCRPKTTTCSNSTQTDITPATSRALLRQYAMTSRLDCSSSASSNQNSKSSCSSDNEQIQPAEKRDRKDYKAIVYDGYVRPRVQADDMENLESMFHSRKTSELYFPKRKQASKAKIIRAAALYRF